MTETHDETLTADSGGSAAVLCSPVWLVFGDHNRHGEWLAGAYDNEAAALAHKKHLDDTQDGWNNFCGGDVRRIELDSVFEPENDEAVRQSRAEGGPDAR